MNMASVSRWPLLSMGPMVLCMTPGLCDEGFSGGGILNYLDPDLRSQLS